MNSHSTVHCVLVAAIIVKALKWKKIVTEFSTKVNKIFIKFWEYLDTKRAIIHMNIFYPKNEKNAIFFQETVARTLIKQKLEISQFFFYVFLMKLQLFLKKR